MAILQLEDGTIYTNFSDIAKRLAASKIQLEHLCASKNPGIQELLTQDILSLDEKERILAAHDRYFEEFKCTVGYRWRELSVLHPGSRYLYVYVTQFDRSHIHADDEALYILAGECIFGFVLSDRTQAELIVQAQEYINIPSGVEHWFRPTGLLDLKAVRYFTTVCGWTPQYTETEILRAPPVVRRYPREYQSEEFSS